MRSIGLMVNVPFSCSIGSSVAPQGFAFIKVRDLDGAFTLSVCPCFLDKLRSRTEQVHQAYILAVSCLPA